MAAATRKALDATALAARERVKAGLPLDEDIFYPPEPPAAKASPPAQPAAQSQSPPKAVHPLPAGQQAARGVQVLQPRGGASERAAARAAAAK